MTPAEIEADRQRRLEIARSFLREWIRDAVNSATRPGVESPIGAFYGALECEAEFTDRYEANRLANRLFEACRRAEKGPW